MPLFTPPRFFSNVLFTRHTNRSVSWLELFYDLVYVGTLIQIGNFLSDNTNIGGFGQFVVLMIVIWWAWTGETFYQNRFVSDDLLHRCLVFLQMFAIATLGISVSQAFGPLYVQFTLAYVIVRLLLVVMYARSMRSHPESRALSWGYVTGFGLGALIWLASLLLPADLHWVGWLVGIAVELSVPLLPGMRRLQAQHTFDEHHLKERFGIFTLIVLGEAFIKVLDDAQGSVIGLPELAFSTFGLIVMYTLWWLYFSEVDETRIALESPLRRLIWLYSHSLLVISLVMFGVGAKKLFEAVIEHPGEPLYTPYRLLYMGAVALYLLALALIEYGTREIGWRLIAVRLFGAAVVVVIGLLATTLDPIGFVIPIAVVMIAQVVESILIRRPAEESAHVAHSG
jgi:low temperature requirement protein LtrA